MHGPIEVLRRGSWWVRAGTIRVHLLDEIDASGLAYDDRDDLSRRVHSRMSAAMRELYGVPDAPPSAPPRVEARAS